MIIKTRQQIFQMKRLPVKIVSYQEELTAIQSIRTKVFQVEQGVDAELEFDGLDADSTHLLAYCNEQPVGTARIRHVAEGTAKVERLAVLPEARNQGIGRELMLAALELISSQEDRLVTVHAQEYIKGLYEKLGFIQIGDEFKEAGISHVKMTKQLGLMSKSQLRQQILQQRRSLSHNEWQAKNKAITQQLRSLSLFTKAKTVLAYFSFKQEPDLKALFNLDKKWGFPRCDAKSLVWHLWQLGDELAIAKYGIKEPFIEAPVIQPQEVDLILVPTVACDRQGYRLGYGGGYYDRLLSSPQWQNIPTVGIVYDFAYLPELPKDTWDIQLDFICTEYQCNRLASIA